MIVALAPMVDVTDTVFRQIIASCGPPDLFWTEFVNVDGLCSPGRPRLEHFLVRESGPTPVIAQIWGRSAANYATVSHDLIERGFAGIDINMGCPDKKIVKSGQCSGLAIRSNWPQAGAIIKAVKTAVDGRLPVSVKTRLGFDQTDFGWHQFLLDQGLDRLIVHGRTTKEMSRVPARWDEIGQVARLARQAGHRTEIIGNGDLASVAQGRQLADRYQLAGVMIGRAVLTNPYLFSPDPDSWHQAGAFDRINLFIRHLELFQATYSQLRPRPFGPLKKFIKLYLTGFPQAPRLRSAFAATANPDQALACLVDFQASLKKT